MSRTAVVAAALLALGACTPASEQAAAPAAAPPVKAAAPAKATAPAKAAAATPPADGEPEAPKVPALKVGEAFDHAAEMAQVHPTPATLRLDQRNGRPLVIFQWATGSIVSRDELVTFDKYLGSSKLRDRADVVAVAGFSSDKGSAADVKDMAIILGVKNVPVLADPDFALSTRLGATQYPDIAVVGGDGKLLARELRGLDHPNLSVSEGKGSRGVTLTGVEYLERVAAETTGPALPRTFPFYPSDRLLKKRLPDTEMPMFSPDGWGKGRKVKLSSLLSKERPTVVMFFSSTCEHCQVDVPQIVRFLKEHPGVLDVVGITRIRHPGHRKVSADYFAQQGITFPVLEDTGAVSDLFKVTSTPTAFYVSPGGTVGMVTYYQHNELEKEWLARVPILNGLPPAPPPAKASGWGFPLKVRDEAGREVDLATMKGRPTLVHFWATWCVPCRKELPELASRMPELKSAANVVFVAVKDERANVAKYRTDTKQAIETYYDPSGGLAESIDFGRSVPRTYILDANGRVNAIYMGAFEWADQDRFSRAMGRLAM